MGDQAARNFAANLEDEGRRVRFLIPDRDSKFTASFDRVVASVGAETVLAPVRSPKANAFAERWVRTVREDCLDQLLVLSRRHLGRLLDEYVEHYNRARPHRSLDLTPSARRQELAASEGSTAATSSAGSSTNTNSPPDRAHPAGPLAQPPLGAGAVIGLGSSLTAPRTSIESIRHEGRDR
jgi:hypothetical protein